jgi:hypothetical protein
MGGILIHIHQCLVVQGNRIQLLQLLGIEIANTNMIAMYCAALNQTSLNFKFACGRRRAGTMYVMYMSLNFIHVREIGMYIHVMYLF